MENTTSNPYKMEFLQVPNVQSLAARCKDSSEIPDIYMRDDIMSEPASNTDGDGVVEIPVIDMSKLIDPETSEHESQRLHLACQEWGFFQLVNHNVSGDLIKRMKADIIEFFELPMEIKMTYSQLPGSFEGYGQMFVVSKEQKLDWGDMLLLKTHPLGERSMPLWPTQPLTSRDTLSRYSEEVYSLVDSLAVWIAKNLGVNPAVFTKDQTQTVRMNYYPPCPLSEKVLGISPHSDNTFITILLQVNEVQGLEIKKDGRWVSVNPLPGAFVVNIGDSLEVLFGLSSFVNLNLLAKDILKVLLGEETEVTSTTIASPVYKFRATVDFIFADFNSCLLQSTYIVVAVLVIYLYCC